LVFSRPIKSRHSPTAMPPSPAHSASAQSPPKKRAKAPVPRKYPAKVWAWVK